MKCELKLFTGTMPSQLRGLPSHCLSSQASFACKCSEKLQGHKKALSTEESSYSSMILCKEVLDTLPDD
jgi:hypothetical protein